MQIIEQYIFDVYILEMSQDEKYYIFIEFMRCELFDSNNEVKLTHSFIQQKVCVHIIYQPLYMMLRI